MSGVIYQPPRIPYMEEGNGNGFNWNFFAKSGTKDGTKQLYFTDALSWTQYETKRFYWLGFTNNKYRIK
jgi:hypothetical protein